MWSPYFSPQEISACKKKNIYLPLRAVSRKAKLTAANSMYFCPLFDVAGNKCRVYALRPFDCRLYPFLLRKRKSGVYLALDTNCPFVHEHMHDPRFQKEIEAVLRYMRSRAGVAMVRANPGLTARYPEKTVRTITRL